MGEFDTNNQPFGNTDGTGQLPKTGLYEKENQEDYFEPEVVTGEIVDQPNFITGNTQEIDNAAGNNDIGYNDMQQSNTSQSSNNGYYQFENPLPSQPDEYQDAYSQAMNYNYAEQSSYEVVKDEPAFNGLCTTALVIGICAFLIDPLYLTSLAAIILGIIGHVKKGPKKNLAMWAWILGIVSLLVQICADTLITVFTLGVGAFVFCC